MVELSFVWRKQERFKALGWTIGGTTQRMDERKGQKRIRTGGEEVRREAKQVKGRRKHLEDRHKMWNED